MPTGFVKFATSASGATSATISAYLSIAGIERSAIAHPPGPRRFLAEDAVRERDPLVVGAGTHVRFGLERGRLYLFDPQTDRAIARV